MFQYIKKSLLCCSILAMPFMNIASNAMYDEELSNTISAFWRNSISPKSLCESSEKERNSPAKTGNDQEPEKKEDSGIDSKTKDSHSNEKDALKKNTSGKTSNDQEPEKKEDSEIDSKTKDSHSNDNDTFDNTKTQWALDRTADAGRNIAEVVREYAPNDGSMKDVAIKGFTAAVRTGSGWLKQGGESKKISREIYYFWEEKIKSKNKIVSISKDLACKVTACSLLDAKNKIMDLTPPNDLVKDAYSMFVNKWNNKSYLTSSNITNEESKKFFLQGMIDHLAKKKLIDHEKCLENEYIKLMSTRIVYLAKNYIEIESDSKDIFNIIDNYLKSIGMSSWAS
jgi:hypothetical protein